MWQRGRHGSYVHRLDKDLIDLEFEVGEVIPRRRGGTVLIGARAKKYYPAALKNN
jgi:hypothetical protein